MRDRHTEAAPNSFTCSEVGVNVVLLTVTDNNGNISTCNANVTVEDNVAPVALCQDITVQLDATGNATITGADIDGGSTDACGIATLVAAPNSFTCSEVGVNVVLLTVTDNNGNISTCNANVTVEDNVAPVALCQDITVQLDATGNATITGADIDGGSTDACGIATIYLSQYDFNSDHIGNNTVVLTARDNSGNTATCEANVEVRYLIDPAPIVTQEEDILCNLDTVRFTLDNSFENMQFSWTVNPDPWISSATDGTYNANTEGGLPHVIEQKLENTGNTVGVVRYTFEFTVFERTKLDTVIEIDIYVNPSPTVLVTADDTLCDGGTSTINVSSTTSLTSG